MHGIRNLILSVLKLIKYYNINKLCKVETLKSLKIGIHSSIHEGFYPLKYIVWSGESKSVF
jgi:hypothetical protein